MTTMVRDRPVLKAAEPPSSGRRGGRIRARGSLVPVSHHRTGR